MIRRIRYRLKSFGGIRIYILSTCCLFIFVQLLTAKLFYSEKPPTPVLSRLYPDMPMLMDLRSYSVCHPKTLSLDKLTAYYHQYS
ncbi:unnamed protein product, partial [Rotaria magnacalcarata]